MIESNAYALVMTETWLKDDILDAEINIEGYRIYRNDRIGQSHGGTCIYLRADISAQVLLS